MNIQEKMLDELKKKYWVVLLCMVLFSVALSVEKMCFTEVVYTPTSAYVQKAVSISLKDNNVVNDSSVNNAGVLVSFLMYDDFIRHAQDKYDYSKIVKGWDDLPADKKVEWWRKHLWVDNVSSGFCMYNLYIPAEEVVDASYIKENADMFLTDYIELSQQKLQKYLGTTGYSVEESFEIPAEQKVVSSKKRIAKYAVIGMILGAMVGIILVFANALRMREHA